MSKTTVAIMLFSLSRTHGICTWTSSAALRFLPRSCARVLHSQLRMIFLSPSLVSLSPVSSLTTSTTIQRENLNHSAASPLGDWLFGRQHSLSAPPFCVYFLFHNAGVQLAPDLFVYVCIFFFLSLSCRFVCLFCSFNTRFVKFWSLSRMFQFCSVGI